MKRKYDSGKMRVARVLFAAAVTLCAFLLADGNIPEVFASSKMGGGETP